MGLDNVGLLVDGAFLLLLAELLVHVQKLIKINSTVSVFTEGSLLLQLCGFSVTHDYYNLSLVEVNQAIL